MKDNFKNIKDTDNSDIIEGRNAISEALRAGRKIDKVYVSSGEKDAVLKALINRARASGAVVSEADRHKLDKLSVTGSHQGIIAVCAAVEYSSIEDILAIADERKENAFIIICDCITDVHNLGAIIRTAEAAGAHGIIIPKHHNAAVSAVVSKTSAGAAEHIAIARVTNIVLAIKELKKHGVWIIGTAADETSDLWSTDFTYPTAVIIGSEGDGMSRLVSEECDFKVSIPMYGKVESLNASVSAALIIYETVRQRKNK